MKNEKTKVGKFLKSIGNLGVNVARSIADGENPVSAIFKAVTNGTMSDEHGLTALQFYQEDLKDVQDARANETARDTSENVPLLTKLIHEIIALIVVISWIISWFVATTIATIEVTGAVMLILGYLFGKSRPD